MSLLSHIHNRFIIPSHKVTIRAKDYGYGSYHDPDVQLLYSTFQILVDYVEIECQLGSNEVFNTPLQNLYEILDYIPGLRWFLPPTRNALQGLLHLKWEMSLTNNPHQAESAAAFYKLYKFWVHDRPKRMDPYDIITDEEAEEAHASICANTPIRFSKSYSDKLQIAGELQDKYHAEDDQMLQLLMKYRRCMWV